MEQSNENVGNQRVAEDGRTQRSFNKRVLIAVIILLVLIAGIALAISGVFSEKKIMAPGPIGSTNSIEKPLA